MKSIGKLPVLRRLLLTADANGIRLAATDLESTSVHPTLDAKEFTERPETVDPATTVPPATMEGSRTSPFHARNSGEVAVF
jgi:hypothetical protein